MRPFSYTRIDEDEAAKAATAGGDRLPPYMSRAQFLAGGTTILDLMKLDVMRPEMLVDINGLERQHGRIEAGTQGLRLGALLRMGEAADNPTINRDYPIIAQSLRLAASQQIRNMATLGGNVLQRTRCPYFRDPSYAACNKRDPGSGCAAIDGINRKHAVLGVSDRCIATYAGDFAQALTALGAAVEISSATGTRRIPFEELHRVPGDTPHVETILAASDLITGFFVPAGPWTRRSLYLVAAADGLSQTDIMMSAGIDRSTTADLVHRLVKMGLLARKRTTKDARRYAVRLTPKGLQAQARGAPAAQAVDRDLLALLSGNEQTLFLKALQTIARADTSLRADGP